MDFFPYNAKQEINLTLPSIGELKSSWDKIVLPLENVENVKLNRWYFINEISDSVDTISLHGFSDASELAYGACIYTKSIRRSGILMLI